MNHNDNSIMENKNNTLIILNGTLCDETIWQRCVHILDNDTAHIACLFPRIDEGTSIETISDSIAKKYLLPKQEHNVTRQQQNTVQQKPWIMGYSFGAIVALECTRKYQKHIAGLILVCANPEGHTQTRQQAVQAQLRCLEEKDLEAVFEEILLPAYLGEERSSLKKEAHLIKTMGLNLGEKILRRQLASLATRIDQRKNISHISLPTMLVCGENDTLCPPLLHHTMHDFFPNSKLTVIPSVGHMLPLLAPEQLAQIIIRTLST